MNKRRGETLIEVVVSFSIMSFVLIGVSGLVTSLVGMITGARTVTQATALAEQGLADGVAVVRSRCDIREESDSGPPDNGLPQVDLGISEPTNGDGLTLTVTLDRLRASEENDSLTDANGFRRVISTVEWTDKAGTTQYYTLIQVVKR